MKCCLRNNCRLTLYERRIIFIEENLSFISRDFVNKHFDTMEVHFKALAIEGLCY